MSIEITWAAIHEPQSVSSTMQSRPTSPSRLPDRQRTASTHARGKRSRKFSLEPIAQAAPRVKAIHVHGAASRVAQSRTVAQATTAQPM